MGEGWDESRTSPEERIYDDSLESDVKEGKKEKRKIRKKKEKEKRRKGF